MAVTTEQSSVTQSEESQSEAVISRLHLSDNQKKLKEDFETKRRREAKDDALKEKQRRKRVCNWHFLIDCLLEIFILNFEQFKSTCRNSVQGLTFNFFCGGLKDHHLSNPGLDFSKETSSKLGLSCPRFFFYQRIFELKIQIFFQEIQARRTLQISGVPSKIFVLKKKAPFSPFYLHYV